MEQQEVISVVKTGSKRVIVKSVIQFRGYKPEMSRVYVPTKHMSPEAVMQARKQPIKLVMQVLRVDSTTIIRTKSSTQYQKYLTQKMATRLITNITNEVFTDKITIK